METPTITIDMDAKCPFCGKMGAVNNGICMKCALKILKHGKRRLAMKFGPKSIDAVCETIKTEDHFIGDCEEEQLNMFDEGE